MKREKKEGEKKEENTKTNETNPNEITALATEIKETEVNKATRNLGIIAGLIVLIIIGILLIPKFYAPQEKSLTDLHNKNVQGDDLDYESYLYNGFSFVKKDGSWYTQIFSPSKKIKYDIPLRYGPKELEDFPIEGNFSSFFKSVKNNDIEKLENQTEFENQVYITFNPNEKNLTYVNLAIGELTVNLRKVLNTHQELGCSQMHEACELYNASLITCEDASSESPVILFKTDEEAKVFEKDYCLTIQGTEIDLMKGVDRLLYKIYLIMD